MQSDTNTGTLYHVLNQGAEILQTEMDIPYLDALGEMGECVFQGHVLPNVDATKRDELTKLISKITNQEWTKEEYRRGMQLAILKGMKEGTQPHHAMTPDAVSLFMGYLLNKVISLDENRLQTSVILDPAVGAGNLLFAVMNQLTSNAHGIGADADETLVKLSYVNANLQEHSVDLFHQDSISAPFVSNVDAVVCDLPVGYYPKDDIASQFDMASEGEHSLVHHLMIEKSMKHIKPGGFLFFLVPNFLFETEEATNLHNYIKKEGIIYSLMQLPKTMFKNEKWGKSILIIRKKKESIEGPKQALLVELPSFSNQVSLQDMMLRISQWFENQLGQK
ncbi:class I SAM-dependent methyltransferase [Evansella tamaricis]|uniref:Class I SAM-dependent methyltransferase n=1 Tax=Evansella tamaricis TaxID=2069301 RepID=A0ABS6JPC2_9BACI|nr:class I SAM-dependent methyltransferase [Evansella tamaricis]MBU9714652.1 class I SAM-dependent methyltransferase [Evansella tamaricis]